MRILHVIPFLWSGAGKVLTELCVSQQARHEVTIVTSGKSKGLTDWPIYRRRLSKSGVEHRRIDFFDRDPVVFSKSVRLLSEYVSEQHPDVVHCHSGVPACAAALVREATSSSFQLISQLHSWGPARAEWMNVMDLGGFKRSDCVIANAGAYRRILMESGIPKKRILDIPWGVAPEAFQTIKSARRQSGRIGFVGRIEPRKGQLELVRAFDILHRSRPGLRLELVGPIADIPYFRRIEKLIRSRRMTDCVWFGGQVGDVYRRERNWDLFVSLSSDEGQGMAILEAMALGVPVVARNCPGVQDYLKDGRNAIALKSEAATSVAQSVLWALDHPEQIAKFSAQARKMVESTYSWDRTVVEMEALYGTR